MSLMERAAEAARELIEARTAQSAALAELAAADPIVLRFVVAEAYARGYLAGLDRASAAVRIEREAVEGELSE